MRSLFAILLATAATTSGCSSSVSPADTISVGTAVSASRIRPGQPATVTVTVANRSQLTLQLMARSGFCPQAFVVAALDGGVVWPSGVACDLDLQMPQSLAAGESVELTAQLSIDGDAGSPQESGKLPVGTYTVRGNVPMVGGRVVQGPPVELRVVP